VGLAAGVALGVFFFWGWDTAANVNEETRDSDDAPGKAGIISMFILLGIFLLVSVAIQTTLSVKAINNPDNQTDILYFFSQQIASSPITYLMILAVLSSTVAVVQTTLLPSSRLSFSMARDGVFPRAFGVVHPRWHTPWVGTLITAVVSVAIILLTVFLDSVNNVFANLILDIGVLVAAYYGVTGIACAWAFRHMLRSSVRMFVLAGALPLLSGLFLFAIAGYVVYNDVSSAIPVLVTMGAGIPLLAAAMAANRTGFFRQPRMAYVELEGRAQAVAADEPAPVA
jgi:amino acid transporter